MLSINDGWKEGSMTALIETTPKMELAIHAIAHLVEELRAYRAISSPLLQRREPREAAHTSLQRLLAPRPRPSIEPMVLAVAGVAPKTVRAMQSFLSAGLWHDAQRLHQPWQAVATALGADDGVLRVDGSAWPQQGVHGVGVQRQDWGEWGKRANCQAGGGGRRQPPGRHLAGASVVYAGGVAPRRPRCRTAQAVGHSRRDHVQNHARVGPGEARRRGAAPAPAVSLGRGSRGGWGPPALAGGGSGAGFLG